MADDLTSYATAQSAFARKRKLAEMLQQQAFAPTEMPTVAGAKLSPWTIAIKALQGGLAGYQSDKLASEEAADSAARKAALADAVKNIPQETPDIPAKPIEQEQVGPPPATSSGPPPGPPPGLAAAFGASGMPDVGPRDNELKGSASPLAAGMVGGAPPDVPPLLPKDPLGAVGAAPPGQPPLLPQKMDMSIPGAEPKKFTDAIPGKKVTPQELMAHGALMSSISPEGAKIGDALSNAGVKGMLPMSPEEVANLAQKKDLKMAELEQKAEAARQRSEDFNRSDKQRSDDKAEERANRLLIAQLIHSGKGDGGATKFTSGVEGASVNGLDVLRDKFGIPHEVVNGVPSKEPYAGPVTPKADQSKGVASAAKGEQGLKDMQGALDAVTADPALFGKRANAGAIFPDAMGISQAVGGLDKDQLKQQSKIASMTADITHSLYGSAFSAGEQARAKKFLINTTDSTEQVQAKLQGRMELEREHYDNLPASAKAAATARQGGGAASSGWGKATKG